VSGGVPLVTLRVLNPIRHALPFWRSRKDLPSTALPNLVAGKGVVGEVVAWGLGGLKAAEEAVQKLLTDQNARMQQVSYRCCLRFRHWL
jgi:hypothetical protein